MFDFIPVFFFRQLHQVDHNDDERHACIASCNKICFFPFLSINMVPLIICCNFTCQRSFFSHKLFKKIYVMTVLRILFIFIDGANMGCVEKRDAK